MTNIIGNSCVSSYITRDHIKQQFVNPFCWNIIDLSSFERLIRKYDKIDFMSAEPVEEGDRCRIIIDNAVDVLYQHYVKDDQCAEPQVKKNKVHVKDLKGYVMQSYYRRIQRMLSGKPGPVWIARHSWHIDEERITEQYIRLIDANEDKNPLILIVQSADDCAELKRYETKNVKVFLTDIVKNNAQLAQDVFNRHFK